MTIDIDSFIEKATQEKENNNSPSSTTDNSFELNENFQSEISKSLENTKEKSKENKDLENLRTVYEQLKKFDQKIPSNFFKIENKSHETLKDIGERYSKHFYNSLISRKSYIENEINKKLTSIDNIFESHKYGQISEIFNEVSKLYSLFPKEFLEEKVKISNEIKKRESYFFNKLEEFKKNELIKIKKHLNSEVIDLKKAIDKKAKKDIEYNIINIKKTFEKIPKYFQNDLIEQKKALSNILTQAENTLLILYSQEFKIKFQEYEKIKGSFHSNIIKKKLHSALIEYNEILSLFNSLPDVFLDKKMELFKDLNDMYSSLSSLILEKNMNLMMQTYNYGKTIEETKSYLMKCKAHLIRPVNETLNNLKEKINSLPQNLEVEKKELLLEIQELMESSEKSKNLNQKKKESTSHEEFSTDLKNKNVNKQLLQEINLHFENLKSARDQKVKQLYYKKILFYLDLIHLEKEEKNKIITKIHKYM